MGTRPGRSPHRSSSPLLDRECSPPHRRHPGCEPTNALALSGACVADIAPCTPNPASSVIMSAVFANRATSSISLSGPAPGQAPHPAWMRAIVSESPHYPWKPTCPTLTPSGLSSLSCGVRCGSRPPNRLTATTTFPCQRRRQNSNWPLSLRGLGYRARSVLPSKNLPDEDRAVTSPRRIPTPAWFAKPDRRPARAV